ncbi:MULTISPECIES: non-ribosomal peptide synthetase [unclassified Massilia]|uniref:non-ribosomal peptide synthetase n=1 Tax=unclassified Massilia TaxID=2609279 RepID=UPI001781359B|nr:MULTISPECIES: non-ribosomal peptide synthetase [unclassified Massilia]MBD8529925.1 amino acid adenylation domain-containing protein [Massilia sp. CFBP 13647]MBD8673878.1 amino acid adenylation domain-containing protein [Massilia sp. CFBP 13721]
MINDIVAPAAPAAPATPASLSAKERLKARLRLHKADALPTFTAITPQGAAATRLSSSQQRLWLLDQLMGAAHANNMSLAIEIAGALDAAALRASLALIVERHEVLRTRVVNRKGQPVLERDPAAGFALDAQEVAGDSEIQAIWRDERRHAFQLDRESLLRVRLLRTRGTRHVLVVTMHHIVSDAWSLGVFVNELTAGYRAFSAGVAPAPAPLPFQYADYAHWQQESAQRSVLAGQADYWRCRLHGMPAALALPFALQPEQQPDPVRAAEPGLRGGAAYLQIPRELAVRLRQLGLQTDSTLFMSLLAAFSILLARRCGQHDFAIGTPVANRARRGTEGLIGFFVNLLVLRCDLAGDPDFGEVLRRTRESVLGAYAHQDIPFEQVVEVIEPERDLNQSPLFQVMFALQNAPVEEGGVAGLAMTPLVPETPESVARYDLTFNLSETGAGILGVMEYRLELFAPETIDNLLAQYLALLGQIAAQPDLTVRQFALLTDWDRKPQAPCLAAPAAAQRPCVELVHAGGKRLHGRLVAQPATGSAAAVGRLDPFACDLARVVLEGDALAPLGTPGELCLAGVQPLGESVAYGARHPFDARVPLLRTGRRAIMRADGSCVAAPCDPAHAAHAAARLARDSEALLRAAAPAQLATLVAHGGRWVAFVQRTPGHAAPEPVLGHLLAQLRKSERACLLPGALRVLDCLPVLGNGEVDRAALRALCDGPAKPFDPPQGEVEQELAAIWADLIPGRRIGRTDNFFAVGGYSLIGAQLVARIRDAFGVAPSLRDVFEQQTLCAQAALVEHLRAAAPPAQERIVPRNAQAAPAGRADAGPLSFSQQRLWFLSRMMPPNAVYNISVALRLRGAIDAAALVRSLDAIVDRHEVLRTRFGEAGGQPLAIIDPPGRGCVVAEDCASEERLRARFLAERGYCFDLAGEPLVRLRLLRTAFDGQLVLLACFHHIVFDGWSMGLFFRELGQLYQAETGAGTPPAPLPIQFADFAHWQRGQLSEERIAGQLAYWEGQLAGLPPLLALPTDRPRPAQQRYLGATRNFVVDAGVVGALGELNRDCGTTLFMGLIAAFATLLGRYAHQHDVAIGTPVANRQQGETEGLIGFFLNSLVMRFDLAGSGAAPTFRSLLGATRETALQAYAHQDVPFEHLVERLNPTRSLAYAPLFQVSCSLVDTPQGAGALPGLDAEPLHFGAEDGVARYDLTMNFSSLPDGTLLGSMEYNTDLFDRATVERMLGHYQRLLAEAVAAPDTALADLDFLGEEERLAQLVDWNRTGREFPQQSVPALFAAQALRQPDAVALSHGGAQLSYGELERRANRLAHYLLAQGVTADACVGLCVERAADMVVGMLGILKAGAAYVPLDPGYPEGRLRQMADASGCRLILSERHLLEELAFLSDYPTLPLDGRWHAALLGGFPESAPPVAVAPGQLAYVIFTSGSTGVPKGVQVSHANIVSLVTGGDAAAVAADAVVAQAASCAFDAITWELWAPLLNGARVLMLDKDTLLSPPALAASLEQHAATALFVTTALFNRISQEAPAAFAGLDRLLFGGEACSPDAIARVLEHGAPRRLLHVYGPTECTTFATAFEIEAAPFLAERQAPIGRPLANTGAYVLQGDQLAPLGTLGELCLGGAGLARGYLGDAAMSAHKFVPHPFAATPGERLYRTGDLVRMRADGAIEFAGRVDHQVKIRGFRIEPGEVEQALRLHPGVAEVLVLARAEGQGERRLVAYLSAKAGATPSAAALAEHLKGRIPDYALPSAFVLLDAWPLNGNGKIDRARLPAPDATAYARKQFVAPAGALELRLAALWQANLGSAAPVGADDNYFAVGGDSIRSIGLVSAARAAGLRFAIKDLFAHPTIAELARVLVVGDAEAEADMPTVPAPFALLDTAERAALPALYRGHEVVDAYPLSQLQQGMWFHSLQHPESSVYHCVITFAVAARWDAQLFRQALDAVVARHPVLRTEFLLAGARPLQFVTAARSPALEVRDLRDLRTEPGRDAEAAIAGWVREEQARGLQLDDPWRIAILLLDEERLQFGLSFHHALWDGWSDAALVAELFGHYKALLQGAAPEQAPPPPPYSAYIALEQEALASPVHGEYWRSTLAGARQPWWAAHPPQPSAHVFCEVDGATSAAMIALAERLGVQEKSVWCTAYVMLTALLDGEQAVLGSVVTHGRPALAGADEMLGLFLNCLPLQVDTAGRSCAELVAQVDAQLVRQQAHRHYPLARIQADLGLDFSASLFNFTNFHVVGNAEAASGVTGSGGAGLDQTNYRFSVDVQKNDAARRHVLRIALDPSVFDAAFQQRIVHYMHNILAALAGDAALVPRRAALLGEDYPRTLGFGAGPAPLVAAADEPGESVQALFEAHARAAPDAIAAVCEGAAITYAELERRAGLLAGYLRRQGVGPEDLVALCLERSLDMLVGLLGVLKAGAAYVPLDPCSPRARIEHMLADSAAPLVLTQQRFTTTLDGVAARLVVLDAGWDEIAAGQPAPCADVPGAGLMYVIYTSGSTGQPKGAMNEQRAVLNRLRWMQSEYQLEPGRMVLQKTPYTFDVSVWELFWPLISGATLVFARPGGHQDPAYLAGLVDAAAIDTLHFVPSMLQVFLDQFGQGNQSDRAGRCPSLATIVCSGEELPAALRQRCLAALPQARLHNLYGPTEAAIDVTFWECRSEEGAARVPIGRPIAGIRMHVLDAALQPVPGGVAGEVYIGGTGVGRGYLARPALTAARFVPDPFSSAPGARLYRTGDLGRWRADGALDYLGRNDHQVKLRGLRIELGEIEACLASHAAVREAVVVARPGADGDLRLVAYLVGAGALDVEALRGHLKAALPDYMVPAAFVQLDALPLSVNGKLDRKALPAPAQDAYGMQAYAAPQGETELLLAAMWQELLRVERIGRHDNFFELGGHSLLALQLMARVRQGLGREFALRQLFDHPTIQALAVALNTAGASDQGAIAVRADAGAAVPLSFAQQRLWFLDQLEGAGAAYHMTLPLHLHGALDPGALQAAFDTIVARHDSLRTAFRALGDEPVQLVLAQVACPVEQIDLRAWPAAERAAEAARRAEEASLAPFDLGAPPLLRVRLLRIADDEHVLVAVVHHIVSDGWSIGVLLRELAALYGAYAAGAADAVALAPLPLQYADYALWQRGRLQGEARQAQADFWTGQLAGAPALLELPLDRPRPPVQSYRGGSVGFALGAELGNKLRTLARRHDATLFMTLFAGLSLLLSRLAGQDQVVIGTPVANRDRTELEGLIGLFVNTLALPARLDERMSVGALLAQVKETTLAAYGHQDLPFEQLVEVLQPVRSLASSPVFQVMLVLDNTPHSAQGLPGLRVAPHPLAGCTEQFDLSLSLHEAGEGIAGAFSYASDLFDETTVARWAGHLRTILGAMADDAQQPLRAISLLDDGERSALTDGFNAGYDPAAAAPPYALAHRWIEAQAARRPQAPAVIGADGELTFGKLTYGELNARANRLAHYLHAQGIGAEHVVGICSPSCPEALVALLGVLKAGAAYLPLDPSYPRERLAFMVEDATPALVLAHGAHAGVLPPGAPVFALDGCDVRLAGFSADNPGFDGGRLAYVMYTSGSTGRPKGVMVEHRQLVSLVAALQDAYGFTAHDRVLQFAALSFDMSVEEIFGALCAGAALVLRGADWLDGGAPVFWRRCVDAGVTVANLPTAFWHGLVSDDDGPVAPTLRQVMIGGEKVSAELVARWFRRDGDLPRLVNAYGPTETTVNAATCVIDDAGRSARLIGRALPNTRIYLLDRHGEVAPLGVAAEVCIGGAGVARGYLNRPALTAERFRPDPFSAVPGARLYRSGDLGRFMADGSIEYLGRNDHQVKIRGFRIELGEIEAVLNRHPAVREALVLARSDGPGDPRLVAYVLAHDDAQSAQPAQSAPLEAQLRADLARALPPFMLPAAFVVLDAFPLLPNGKLDRKALPAPGIDAGALQAFEAPREGIESMLAAVWCELLGRERVGRNDNFFELGGHSLLAVRLMTRIRQVLGREITLRQLFEYPTIHSLALHLAGARAISLSAIGRADRTQPLPLSWAQQRLWFIDRLEGGGGAVYNMPEALHLRGSLERAALQGALDALVERHEALRTVFAEGDGAPAQIVVPAAPFDLRVISLEHLDGEAREAGILRHTEEEALAPFDLETGPLIRARLLCLSAQEHVFLVTTHHIVSDGVSSGIMVAELAALYAALVQGRAPALAPLPIQYPDFAVWQRQWLQGELLQAQLDYWKTHLAGAPPLLELPLDRARPSTQSHRGGHVVFTAGPELAAGLKALAQGHDTTLFASLYTGFAIVLSALSGQDDLVIGTPSANRQRTEVEGLIGFFVNTLALRADLSGNPSVAALLAQVKGMTLDAYSHPDLPFEQVVDALQPPRSLGHSPLFQAMLVLQNSAQGDLALPGLQVAPRDIPYDIEKFDLSLTLQEVGGDLVGRFSYAADLFERDTIVRWVGYFKSVLAAMVRDPQQRVHDIDMLGAAERACLVDGLNDSAMAFRRDALLHGLFEEQVARTPDAVALVHDGQRISYAELNRQANRVAHTLLARGIGAEACVGICLPRTPACVGALLGVLKAGACYVPIDPAYPADRVQYLLGDADMAALVTTSGLRDALAIDAARCLFVDAEGGWSAACTDPALPIASSQLAYVIYTSGSTGRPKGVPLTHQGGVSLLEWACRLLPFEDRSGILAGTSLCFDLSIYELFLSLSTGATCILVDNILGLENLDAATREQVTLVNTVPSAAKALLERNAFPPSVRVLNLAGEPLRAALVDRLHAETTIGSIYDLYGPSEATTYSSFARRHAHAPETIGRPVANNQFYVLDKGGRLAPFGAVGELYIGATGLARGYLQRPALSAEKFLPNPFGEEPGARMYRTGDLVRYRAGGDLEYLGRADHQVKVRGFRIELGEIESACLRHPGIKEAVVIVREDSPDLRQIVAYVVPDPLPAPVAAAADADGHPARQAALLVEGLRARLKGSLPGFMMPSAVLVLAQLPLTPNGKLDRKALPAPDGSDTAQAYEAPVGDIEERIVAVWEELLQRKLIGRQDNFFALGGHSLIAVVAVSRMRQVGLNIALDAFFKHPTVKAMADFMQFGDETALWKGGAVVMREQGDQRPLFLVHEITGDIFPLFPLSRHLADGIPVYGLPLTKESSRESVPQLAASHLRAMRKVQPQGPYRVAGHSFGGVLAFEIASQLAEAGERVEFLGMIDTYRPYYQESWADEVTDIKVLLIYVEILHPTLAPENWAILHGAADAGEALDHCKAMGLFPHELGLAEVMRWAENMGSILVMGANYAPKPLRVPAYQFTADGVPYGDRDWTPLLGESLREVHVGGSHLNITQEPQVEALAQAMSAAIAAGTRATTDAAALADVLAVEEAHGAALTG